MLPTGYDGEQAIAFAVLLGALTPFTWGRLRQAVVAVLAPMLVATMLLSDMINNAAITLVMAPIVVGITETLGFGRDAFLMAVAMGATCSF